MLAPTITIDSHIKFVRLIPYRRVELCASLQVAKEEGLQIFSLFMTFSAVTVADCLVTDG
jgi:hypothetical protein